MADQPAAPGAQRRAYGKLEPSLGRTHQQQVGDVDARDQQNQSDRAQEQEQSRPDVPNDLLFIG